VVALRGINRFQAFGWHFLMSVAVASLLASIVFFVWFPQALAYASGVSEIFMLLVVVDVVLGPIITLIVFNPAKKELRRDLSIVVVIQLGALLYGMYSVFLARPVYLVFNTDRFDVVYASDLTKKHLIAAEMVSRWALPLIGPDVVGAKLPADPVLAQKIMYDAVTTGEDVQYRPQYYVAYAEMEAIVKAQMQSIEKLSENNLSQSKDIDALMTKYRGRDVGYLPVMARAYNVVGIVGRGTGELLEVYKLNP